MFEQNPIRFRKAELKDAEILAEYRVKFLNELYPGKAESQQAELKSELTSYFKDSLAENTLVAWLAEIDDEVISTSTLVIWKAPMSYSGLHKSGKRGYILNMYTITMYRKKGIAGMLLDKLIEEAKNLGLEYVHLHATNDGIEIYRKRGFKEPHFPELKLEIK